MKVAGFGFRKGAAARNLAAALEATGCASVEAFATVQEKAVARPIEELAGTLGVPIVGVPADAMVSVVTPTQSQASLNRFGTGSLAEASALLAAGRDARLLTPRAVSPCGMATCAIAEGEGS